MDITKSGGWQELQKKRGCKPRTHDEKLGSDLSLLQLNSQGVQKKSIHHKEGREKKQEAHNTKNKNSEDSTCDKEYCTAEVCLH